MLIIKLMFKFFEKKSWLSWLIVIIIAGIIFYISSLTFKPSPYLGWGFQTILYHFFAFFWLAFFLMLALIKGKRKNLFLPALLIIIIYAVSDEIHQLFVPGRVCSFADFLIDSAGILFSSFLYILSFKHQNSTRL